MPRKVCRNHLPRVTGEVRAASDVTVSSAPFPSRPRRMSSSGPERDAAELAAVDVRDAVVLRQPFVDERVVRRQQIEDAAVLVDDAVEEQLHLAPERLAQIVVEVREHVHDRLFRLHAAHVQPLPREVARPAPRDRGSAIIRRTCCSSTAGSLSLPCVATVSSSSSGMLLHRKNDNREASSRSLMR